MKIGDYSRAAGVEIVHIEGFDDCIIGMTCENPIRAVYSSNRIVASIMRKTGISRERAELFFDEEIVGQIPDIGVPGPILIDEVTLEV